MEMVKVKKWNDIQVSRLGYGCMRFPMTDGKVDRAASQEMVDAAYKGGVNYYDTAYVYLNGDSETFIGEALAKYPRDSFYIATKLPVWNVKQREDVKRLFEEQLNKLQMERIDFYLLHALNAERFDDLSNFKIIEQMAEEKAKGRISYLGFSYHGDFEVFKKTVELYDWDFAQIQINYIDYDMKDAKSFYDVLAEKGIPCIVMEPVRGGYLANPAAAAKAEMNALDASVSPAAWALRWCMDLDNAPVILSGMNTLEQVEENLVTFGEAKKLTQAEKDMFGRVLEIFKNTKSVPCTACGYCMDCPYGVDIPGVFSVYNVHQLFNSTFRARMDYMELKTTGRDASKCVQCGACAPQCPQEIAIPEKLKELDEFILKLQ